MGNYLRSTGREELALLADKQKETSVEFTAPTKPGKYLYVCTYIAHAGSMRGYMIVE